MTLKAVEASDLVDLGHRIGWNLEAGGLHVVLQLAGLGSDFGERKGKSVTVADLTGVGVKAGIPRTRCIAIANEMQDRIRDAGFAVRD